MILILTKKDDLISYGFYYAYKTIYKYVDIIDHISQYKEKKYNFVVINNFDFCDKIKLDNSTKYILINENILFENKLKNNNCKYVIVKEYSSLINLDGFKQLDKNMYHSNNLIIMPYGSIFTKNQILWNYKKDLIKNKIIPKNIKTYENTSSIAKELIGIKYDKINIKKVSSILDKCKNNKFIYITNYDPNKIDFMGLTFMAYGNYVMRGNKQCDLYTLKFTDSIKNVNLNRIVQNIEIIYNDYTFEKYVKILNYFLLSV